MNESAQRAIPGVDTVLDVIGDHELPRAMVVDIVRATLAEFRKAPDPPARDEIIAAVAERLERRARTRLQMVINATGVVVHTNLGRAPLGAAAASVLHDVATAYNNLELDLDSGRRGSRGTYLEHSLALLCKAEAATVVNNNAAALVLILRVLCDDSAPEVVISRGELIQIGGGFRIPDILESSGATLREVGTTNQTTIDDYAGAVSDRTAMILKVHRSNFFMEGFVESPARRELADLARRKRVTFVEDLGSGAIVDTEQAYGLDHEPTPAEVLKGGGHLVCFSGDKLLGGPQAGIIAGRRRLIARLKKDPFFRALRCDKLIMAAMERTVDSYLADGATDHVPVLQMLAQDLDSLRSRAAAIVSVLADCGAEIAVVEGHSQVGGGTLPRAEIPSVVVAIKPRDCSARELAERLRHGQPPVIGTVAGGRLRLDLRTVFNDQGDALCVSLRTALD